MKKTFSKRILSLVLSLIMVLTLVPTSAVADGDDPETTYVAQIGDTKYETVDAFKTAWAAISGEASVTLLADVDLGSSYLTVASGQTITLDLNGKTLISSAYYTIRFDGGALTVNDSSAISGF